MQAKDNNNNENELFSIELNQWKLLFKYSNPIFGKDSVAYRITFENGFYYIDYRTKALGVIQTNQRYSTMQAAMDHSKRLANDYLSTLERLNKITS